MRSISPKQTRDDTRRRGRRGIFHVGRQTDGAQRLMMRQVVVVMIDTDDRENKDSQQQDRAYRRAQTRSESRGRRKEKGRRYRMEEIAPKTG